MRELLPKLRSRLRNQIILPFLLLTLVVALAGAAVAFSMVASTAQEELESDLVQATRAATAELLNQERENLDFLREIAFSSGNSATGAPAVADALSSNDSEGLRKALDAYFGIGLNRNNLNIDRLIAFNRSGTSLADFERAPFDSPDPYLVRAPLDFSSTWLVPEVLAAKADPTGDKFAGLLKLPESDTPYFATIAPVRQGGQVVGGLIVAIRSDRLLALLAERAQAPLLTLYDTNGTPLATSMAGAPARAQLEPTLVQQTVNGGGVSSFSSETINGATYQNSYTPLQIRNNTVGLLEVGLLQARTTSSWSTIVGLVLVVTLTLIVAIIALGWQIARGISRPLEELAHTAQLISGSDQGLPRVEEGMNEIGVLSLSFNRMTSHLMQLITEASTESSKLAAVVDSIADGIIVCDDQGQIQLMNRATRRFLNLPDHTPPPQRLSDMPLVRLTEGVPGFDTRWAQNLYSLGEVIVRVSVSPVINDFQQQLGFVCVLQNLTDEVAVDRAKNNFIGTISHELRTPLMVMRGTTDLLLRGLAGPLDEDQRVFVENLRQHAANMSNIINNVIDIAGLDSGTLTIELEPVQLQPVLEEAIWPLQSLIRSKGLSMHLDLPDDLPTLLADPRHLRTMLHHLVDNARRYTTEGEITIRARSVGSMVQIDVCDTGRGIPSTLRDQLFTRFTRASGDSEGINSAERGIGLGLAIVKQLAERQGGKVWLASSTENGSTFSFTLPTSDAAPHPEKHDSPLVAAA
ncbi:MAG: ATP-binding protein [Chloroflexaceae bacterium]|jgi:signal transduction histidine kinase|nr:ATP-binding protein [Chloroflexaceae bacterium]